MDCIEPNFAATVSSFILLSSTSFLLTDFLSATQLGGVGLMSGLSFNISILVISYRRTSVV
ncbi:hypothetical protein HanRHA438_Chr10g0454651 [Helianthus annuus]|nr:hypothetical protein HanRHA438_Chr10g0454651 [Helianthus annuus]